MSDPTSQEKRKGSWWVFGAIFALCLTVPFCIFMMIPQENKLAWRLVSQGHQITHDFNGGFWIWPRDITCDRETQISNEALQLFPKFRHVYSVSFEQVDCTGLGLEPLTQMQNLTDLYFFVCTNVQPEELLKLGKCSSLAILAFCKTPLTSEILEIWENIPLQYLWLESCELADRELESISKFAHVHFLRLQDNPDITDAGLEYLIELKQLHVLNLRGTSVTEQGIKDFRAKHPNGGAMVIYDDFTP